MEDQFAVTYEAYKRWLGQQDLNDARDRSIGLPQLPRSREEQMAIYYSMPRNERIARERRKVEARTKKY